MRRAMLKVTLVDTTAIELEIGEKVFCLSPSDSGGLYIEAPGDDAVTIEIADDAPGKITIGGLWAIIDIAVAQEN